VPHKKGPLRVAWTGTTGGEARSPGPRQGIGPRWHRVRAIQVARCCDRGGAGRPVRRWLGQRRQSVPASWYQLDHGATSGIVVLVVATGELFVKSLKATSARDIVSGIAGQTTIPTYTTTTVAIAYLDQNGGRQT
jgi:hypothetical protein